MIDTERNIEAYLHMTELVRSGRALAFLGAGVSCPLEYPDWARLIQCLAAEVRATCGEDIESNGQTLTVDQVVREYGSNPLVQAQILKENLQDRYFAVMRELFGPKKIRSVSITNLVRLPFKHLLTSNYDPALELHHSPPEPVAICLHHHLAREFIYQFGDDGYARRIVHVHGRYDEPENIILTEEDYGRYVGSAVLDEFWRVVPAAARLVFFGFGFGDLDLLHSFRRRRMLLGNGHNHGDTRHFAVLPLEDPKRDGVRTVEMRMRYGVEPIFFQHRKNGSFAEYDELISRLQQEIGAIGTPLPEEVAAAPPEAAAPIGPMQPVAQDYVPPDALAEDVGRLRRLTRENIERRPPGEFE
jgi:hypothetical protein